MPGTLTFPLACFVGLAVAGTEVTAAGYVRQPCTLALCGDGITYANTASLQWQHAAQPWGALDTVQIWDTAVGGARLGLLTPLAAVTIAQYDIARIPASGLAVTYDKASRPYGTGRFGTFAYGTMRAFTATSVLLERGFDQQHVCSPGTWAPGPFSLAA
jgi:hypothetical protein